MLKNKKKGFTIVELVIVIAVIGILAAVLIPTFSGLVNKANVAADTMLVGNINRQLEINAVNDGKNLTMYDALQDAKEAGYLVSNINARSNNILVWDQDLDRFALLDKDGNVIAGKTDNIGKKHRLWCIYSSLPENQVYSIYAGEGFDSSDVAVSVGFDSGDNQSVKKITYTGTSASRSVTIRTNDTAFVTELVVNAEHDTVCHYGMLESAEIQAVDLDNSYHEYGKVKGALVAKKGHVVMEAGSNVTQLLVDKNSTRALRVEMAPRSSVQTLVVDSQTATVEIKNNSEVETLVNSAGGTNVTVDPRVTIVEVQKTTVNSESEFNIALQNRAKYIVIGDDFSASGENIVLGDTTIDGNGKTITYSKIGGMFLTLKTSNVSLNIQNLNFVDSNPMNSNGGKAFLKVGNDGTELSGIVVNLSNVNAEIRYYCLNLRKNAKLELNIMSGCVLKGWSAINSWAYDSTINVTSSTLIGRSISNEGFGTLVYDGGAYFTEGSTTHGLKTTINNSTLKQITTGYSSSVQQAISIQYGAKMMEVYINNCTIVNEGEGSEILYSAFDTTNGSKIYRDGQLIYSGVEFDTWYSNDTFTTEKVNPGFPTSFDEPFKGWLANGEGMILQKNIVLTSNIICSLSANNRFYLYLDGHTITGGNIILNIGVSVISDTNNIESIFACNNGSITKVVNGDGTYTYTATANE